MLQPPLGDWTANFPSFAIALRQAPFEADWQKRAGIVSHGFTHFELEIDVYAARVTKRPRVEGRWIPRDALADVALPTVMRKIVERGLDEGTPLLVAKPRRSRDTVIQASSVASSARKR